jgi:signal transduction histidine kinase
MKPLNRARLEIAIEQSMSQPRNTLGCDLMRLNRDQLLECLLHANLKLQEFDQDRSHFLARAIHELRAPLTSLNGYCGLLLDRKLGALSAEQMNVLSRMRRSVTRLARIVSTMFDLSVGKSSEYNPDYRIGNITACIEQALHEVVPMLRERRIELTVDLSAPMGPLSFDSQQMEQVFLNLLDNSCKFASRGGYVQVRGYPYFWERRSLVSKMNHPSERRRKNEQSAAPNAYRIDIEDNGPGIPVEQLETVFAEYSVYGGGNDRSGTGLGLAIARMIVRQHSGRIWAESREPEGARFCVVLQHANEAQTLSQNQFA